MMLLILSYYDEAQAALERGVGIDALVDLAVREKIGRYKYTPQDQIVDEYEKILAELKAEIAKIGYEEA